MSENVEGESSRIVYRVQLNLNIDLDCLTDIVYRVQLNLNIDLDCVTDISDIVYRVSDIC